MIYGGAGLLVEQRWTPILTIIKPLGDILNNNNNKIRYFILISNKRKSGSTRSPTLTKGISVGWPPKTFKEKCFMMGQNVLSMLFKDNMLTTLLQYD